VKKIKEALDVFMMNVKKQNPDANWANLLTGVGIFILIAVFSIWYFGKGPNAYVDKYELSDEVSGQGESFAEEFDEEGNVIVQKGEGLWQVAERVCGDGELYNFVALENNISHWALLEQGQRLKVSCDYYVKP